MRIFFMINNSETGRKRIAKVEGGAYDVYGFKCDNCGHNYDYDPT